jgi:hypothetical protein
LWQAGVTAGDLSCSDEGGGFLLKNGLAEAVVAKKNGYITDFHLTDGKSRNIVGTDMSFIFGKSDRENPQMHECHWDAPAVSDKDICLVMRQEWERMSVEERITLPAQKTFLDLSYTFKPKKTFSANAVMAGFKLTGDFDTRIFGDTSKTNRKDNQWYQYPNDFVKPRWLAFQSRATRDGVSILLPEIENWGSFLSGLPWGKNGDDGFSLQLFRNFKSDAALTPDDTVTVSFRVLAFRGDAKAESENALEQERGKEPSAPAGKKISATRTAKAPVIDGSLDDECWSEAQTAGNFQLSKSQGEPPVNQTEVSFCYDDENLYFSFVAHDIKMPLAKALETKRDGLVWQDDDIELFLMTDPAGKSYYQFAWNILGTEYDSKVQTDGQSGEPAWKWNSNMRSKVTRLQDRWQGEALIPWKDLGIDSPDKKSLRMDVCRSKLSRQDSPEEQSNLFKSPTGAWHRPNDFGSLWLSGMRALPSLLLENQTELAKDRSAEAVKLKMRDRSGAFWRVQVKTPGESKDAFVSAQTVRAVPERGLEFPFATKEKGKLTARISLSDTRSGETVLVSDYALVSKYNNSHRPGVFQKNDGYLLWTAGPAIKITPDDEIEPSGRGEAVELSLAKNEYEPFQIIVTPQDTDKIKNFRLEFSDLKSENGIIPKENIKWNQEGYIKIDKPSPVRDAFPGMWPDPLLKGGVVSVDSKRHYPVWVTVYAPGSAAAGVYSGSARVIVNDRTASSIPLKVKVWDFTLPDNSFLDSVADVWYYGPMRGKVKYSAVLDNVRRHKHSSAGRVFDSDPQTMRASYDEYFEKYKMRHALFPGFAGAGAWKNRRSYYGLKIDPSDKVFRETFIEKTRELADFYKKNGWSDRMIFWLWDEPFLGTDPELRKNLPLWVGLVREAAPGMKTMLSHYLNFDKELDSPHALDGMIDILTVPLYFGPAFSAELAKLRRSQGIEVWGYHNQWYLTDCPAVNARAFAWILWSNRISGYIIWSVNNWSVFKYDPWNYGGGDLTAYRGDGCLFYPDKETGELLDSLRWEILRDGLEDYDYLSLCETALKSGKLSAEDKKEAEGLLAAPLSFAADFDKCTRNPDDILNTRERLGNFLEKHRRLLEGSVSLKRASSD